MLDRIIKEVGNFAGRSGLHLALTAIVVTFLLLTMFAFALGLIIPIFVIVAKIGLILILIGFIVRFFKKKK